MLIWNKPSDTVVVAKLKLYNEAVVLVLNQAITWWSPNSNYLTKRGARFKPSDTVVVAKFILYNKAVVVAKMQTKTYCASVYL